MESYPKHQFTISAVPGTSATTSILRLSGPFTIQNLQEFQAAARGTSAGLLIVDLTDVPYVDSAAVGSLVGVHVSSEGHNRRYAIVGVNQRIRTVCQVSKVDQFLVFFETAAEAEAALSR